MFMSWLRLLSAATIKARTYPRTKEIRNSQITLQARITLIKTMIIITSYQLQKSWSMKRGLEWLQGTTHQGHIMKPLLNRGSQATQRTYKLPSHPQWRTRHHISIKSSMISWRTVLRGLKTFWRTSRPALCLNFQLSRSQLLRLWMLQRQMKGSTLIPASEWIPTQVKG